MPRRAPPSAGSGLDRCQRHRQPGVRGAAGPPAGRGGGCRAAGGLRSRLRRPAAGPRPRCDLAVATHRVAGELPGIVEAHDATIVVSPSPHDVHHGHEAVGRGVDAPWRYSRRRSAGGCGVCGVTCRRRTSSTGRPEGARPGAPHSGCVRGRARMQRLPALPRRAGRRRTPSWAPSASSASAPRRHRPPVRRAADRGPACRRPLHGLRAAPPRRGPEPSAPTTSTSRRGSTRRPCRAGGLHPRGPGADRRRDGARPLTPRLVEDFRRDGFVVVPDLLSADELVRFGAAVDQAVARRSRHDRGRWPRRRSTSRASSSARTSGRTATRSGRSPSTR